MAKMNSKEVSGSLGEAGTERERECEAGSSGWREAGETGKLVTQHFTISVAINNTGGWKPNKNNNIINNNNNNKQTNKKGVEARSLDSLFTPPPSRYQYCLSLHAIA